MSATSPERVKRRWRATRSRWRTATSMRSTISAFCEAKAMSAEVTYKTHILIGVRANGVKTVIADWSLVPKQKGGVAVAGLLDFVQDLSSAPPRRSCLSRATAPAAEIRTGVGSERFEVGTQKGTSDRAGSACRDPMRPDHYTRSNVDWRRCYA